MQINLNGLRFSFTIRCCDLPAVRTQNTFSIEPFFLCLDFIYFEKNKKQETLNIKCFDTKRSLKFGIFILLLRMKFIQGFMNLELTLVGMMECW